MSGLVAAAVLVASPELYPRSSLDHLTREELLRRETHLLTHRPSWIPPFARLGSGLLCLAVGGPMVAVGAPQLNTSSVAPYLLFAGIPGLVVGFIFTIVGLVDVREIAIARENIDWDIEELRARRDVLVRQPP